MSLRSGVHFTTTVYFNLDTKFSLEILIKFTVEKIDSHTQVVLNV